ncbi:phenylalanine--tRNA ligase subunit beta [Motiliproteus coralliicola]|uniref:Phenylalanine--tRNA ligase beta subunit n=1 Tax=Motiliproteus coralliicola TaxID=2283196 RepID=A0A369WQD2_9GAMM|nr:phenylalanine--tRNA ligase subunit beta [Motiliproteus coralliicola]RDE22824.1 phenylalanine--tRNA ligase subunit beta [Motiliproteus coralliicola]
MKFSEKWLREWVNPAIETDALVAQITMAGLEVDGVEPAAAEFSGVVIGEIEAAEQHPNADKLQVCRVSDGNETFQVVCGAPNARAGLRVAFAKVGAVLPGNFKIKKAKLRQVESFGMLCSGEELGINEDNDGIMELPLQAQPGQDLREFFDLDDQIIEVDLTPNRGDCLSIAGLAREVGVLNKAPVTEVAVEPVAATIDDTFPIEIEAGEGCARFVGRVIKGIDPTATTPVWMVEKLRRSGIRSIDPVVDITNYVMLELGQPMHAYDLATLNGGIRVRMAESGEKLTLLDGQECELNNETLLIADHQGPLGLAGIMGGEGSGVAEQSRDIFLECAYFNPLAIAGKARSYGLHTDASHRFERGVDPELQVKASERATALLLEIVGGEAGPITEVALEQHLPASRTVKLRAERIKKLLSLDIEADEVEEILTRLGMGVSADGDSAWQVDVPAYRFDVSLEEDLLEELARIYGYNRMPVRTNHATLKLTPQPEAQKGLPDLRRLLVARGYQEAITYSFVEPGLLAKFDSEHQPVALANPISADMAVMRTTLWPGLIKAMQHNQHRQQSRIRLFETGQRFVPGDDGLIQDDVIAGALFGTCNPEGWTGHKRVVDFFDVKGDLEALLAVNGDANAFEFEAAEHQALHPGQTAAIKRDGELVGYVGALHPSLCKELGLNGPVFLFELALDAVMVDRLPAFSELSKYPGTSRDMALVVDQQVAVAKVLQLTREKAGEWLKDVTLFDVYSGEGIENGKKSLALSLTWQHPSHTLNDEQVNQFFDAVVTAAEQQLGAVLRS